MHFAIERHEKVVVVYVHPDDEEKPWEPGAASNWWLHHSLQRFDEQLQSMCSRLIIRRGRSLKALLDLAREVGAQAVYWNRLYDPALIKRDTLIKSELEANGLATKSFASTLLREPWDALKGDGSFYRVYTPFSHQYFKSPSDTPCLAAPDQVHGPASTLESVPVGELDLMPSINWYQGFDENWTPGSAGATARIERFCSEAADRYHHDRDLPSLDGVSRLSPHLHFGEVSPKQVWFAIESSVGPVEAGISKPFLGQLVWRDFAHHLLFHLPHTPIEPFRDEFNFFPWVRDEALFDAWAKGSTGVPIIDAGMRELWHTGWMHNRVRMLVASFLTKNGLIHWTEGAKWFWDTLVDASLANNTMGWQWVAGCGVDAAPYFRIFNPVRQGERFDTKGDYVRKWVPEIAALPDRYIHEPWNAPPTIQLAAKTLIGKDYPKPVLDLSKTRVAALEKHKATRAASGGG